MKRVFIQKRCTDTLYSCKPGDIVFIHSHNFNIGASWIISCHCQQQVVMSLIHAVNALFHKHKGKSIFSNIRKLKHDKTADRFEHRGEINSMNSAERTLSLLANSDTQGHG